MEDLTQCIIKDKYTGKLIRESTPESLGKWLKSSYKTLTVGQEKIIDCLVESLEHDMWDNIITYGAACDLDITPKKKTRRKAK